MTKAHIYWVQNQTAYTLRERTSNAIVRKLILIVPVPLQNRVNDQLWTHRWSTISVQVHRHVYDLVSETPTHENT